MSIAVVYTIPLSSQRVLTKLKGEVTIELKVPVCQGAIGVFAKNLTDFLAYELATVNWCEAWRSALSEDLLKFAGSFVNPAEFLKRS